MARIEQLREEIGWLKIVFAALIAVDVSLVGWLAQNYGKASWLLLLAGFGAAVAATSGIVRINGIAYDRIDELKDV